jgi:ABC-type branched-subunit amino acid transport system substrate-binding protein
MKRRHRFLSLFLLTSLALLIAFISPANAQQPLTPQEIRGKQIYLQGTSSSGEEILAYVGDSSLEVPGKVMACANCHGLSGQGKTRDGITPSNITWEALTKPHGAAQASGRKHPAYTDRALELAITRGLDPGGNKLLKAMPRFQMSKADLDDLIVYLKRLGTDLDPGVSEQKIVIGTAIPNSGPLADLGQAVRDVIAAVFAETNLQGGVYNRQLELKTVAAETKVTRADLDGLIKGEKVFALAGVVMAGVESEIVPFLGEQQVPLIGPLTLDPRVGSPLNRHVFYTLTGNAGQARALISFVARRPESKSLVIAVIQTPNELNSHTTDAIKEQTQRDGLTAPQIFDAGSFPAAEMVTRLRQANVSALFFLGSSADLQRLLTEAAKVNWFPQIFLQSGNADARIFTAPQGFDGKILFTVPTAPRDIKEEGSKEFRALAEKYKLTQKHVAAQIASYGAAKILIEALKRAGKDLSREKLIQALEGFAGYQTGVLPPITYGPNRRVGVMGAYIVTVDLKGNRLVPVSEWVEIN